jgi:hypothetical protein
MSEWLLQVVLIVLALVLFGGLIYSLVFSSRSNKVEDKPQYGGYERREQERLDRRKQAKQAPADVGERRQGPRRTDE